MVEYTSVRLMLGWVSIVDAPIKAVSAPITNKTYKVAGARP
jgi:hypothetical protein